MTRERLLAVGLAVLALAFMLLAQPQAWPLVLMAGAVAVALTWIGADNGSIIAAPIVLIGLAVVFMFAQDGLALGPLIACVLALLVGDVLASARSNDDRGPVTVVSGDLVTTMVATAAIAIGAMVVVMLVALLPGHRMLTLAGVVALVGLTAVAHRRRTTLPHSPLPPPPVGGSFSSPSPH